MDDFGFVEGMERQAKEFEKWAAIGCMFSSELRDISLDKELSAMLFRIYQEALKDIIKHAKATKVVARLIASGDCVVLEIADNGIGMRDEQFMRERVRPWGGHIEINTIEGVGATVKVIIPFPPKSSVNNRRLS